MNSDGQKLQQYKPRISRNGLGASLTAITILSFFVSNKLEMSALYTMVISRFCMPQAQCLMEHP